MQSSWNYQLFYQCTADEDGIHGIRSKSNKCFYFLCPFGLFLGFTLLFVWYFLTAMSGDLKIGTLENGLFGITVIFLTVLLLFSIPIVCFYSYKKIRDWYIKKFLKRRKWVRKNENDISTTLLLLYNLMQPHLDGLNQVETNIKQRLQDILEQLSQIFGVMDLFLAGSVPEKYCMAISQGGKEGRAPERTRHAVLSDNDCMVSPLEQFVSFQRGIGKYQVVSEGKFVKTKVPFFFLQDENGDFLSALKLKEIIFRLAYDSKKESCMKLCSSTEMSFYQSCTCQRNFLTVDIKGPSIRYELGNSPFEVNRFYCDLVFAFKCYEWPDHLTDWGRRTNQIWPSQEEVSRIKSQGCHFVPKSDPNDVNELTWRISFSNAEYELSKIIPPVARMCMIGMKIITKDYLNVVCRELTSYHVKSIFLFMVERNEPHIWREWNLEYCFRQLLLHVKDCIKTKSCPNFWIPSVNMFQDFTTENVEVLMKQIERIEGAPNKFIEPFDVNHNLWREAVENRNAQRQAVRNHVIQLGAVQYQKAQGRAAINHSIQKEAVENQNAQREGVQYLNTQREREQYRNAQRMAKHHGNTQRDVFGNKNLPRKNITTVTGNHLQHFEQESGLGNIQPKATSYTERQNITTVMGNRGNSLQQHVEQNSTLGYSNNALEEETVL
ncbi:uncharacterized protein [Clytia hemisphaerica]|uniref:uncharacterized protein n=1 Tax=Clytia hemisphaerica TaxID=252671 RepID=UPI0034D5A5BA